METLGYIVSDRKIDNLVQFVERVTYKEYDYTTDKPTLFVGYSKAKNIDGFTTILDKKLSPNRWWTFGKTEKRSDYLEDISIFQYNILLNIINNLNYIYINPFILNYTNTKKILKYFNSLKVLDIYIRNGMLYFAQNMTVYGISLSMLRYCKVNVKKHLTRLKNDPRFNVVEEDTSEMKILRQYISNKKYAMAYFIKIFQTTNEPKT